MKSLLALTLLAAVAMPTLAADAANAAGAKPDLAKGQASAQVCVACHTVDGSRGAPANPILAGQHADYLAQALKNYRDGRRNHPIMSMQVKALGLTDEDIGKLAQYFSGKQGLQTLKY